ncbi:MAG: DnaJ domain-containing protein [Sphingomicrobium sp.]
MTQDHYAILGVPPTADASVIRAAYIALMREYHPDRNPSPAAVARAQAIGAAYKVLGDFDRRNHYDWDRRRAREQASAELGARPKRALSATVVIAAAAGLAAVAGMLMQPGSQSIPPPAHQPQDAVKAELDRPPANPVPGVRIADREAVVPSARKVEPLPAMKPLPELYPKPPPDPALSNPVSKLAERETMRRPSAIKVAMIQPPPVKATPVAIVKPATKPVVATAMTKVPSKPPPAARTAAATDLAELDQFVMAFYGQSWRFGDARKRSALEQSRNGFVERRGACLADACKRAAYLKLQRDVSAIVESGQSTR